MSGKPDTLTRNGITIPLSKGRAHASESLLDYLARMTRGHASMCSCDFCRFLRAM